MTIERFSFRPAVRIDAAGMADLDHLLVFADHTVIPPEHSVDITPPGYKGKFRLLTRNQPGEIEDTVGEIRQSGNHIREVPPALKRSVPKTYEVIPPEVSTIPVDENSPIVILASLLPSAAINGPVAISLSEIVRYFPAGQQVDELEAKEALYEQFANMLRTSVPVER
jgi:hypothetical protein